MPANKPALCRLRPHFVNWIHDEWIGLLWPESDPISPGEYRSAALLESALGRPFHSMFGQDAYPTVLEKAAALFHSLIANHPFQNGNKRTAAASVYCFLVANGYILALTNPALYDIATRTASYRERRVSHDDALRYVLEKLTASSVPQRFVYRIQKKEPEFAAVYRSEMEMRRLVRRANPAVA